MPENLVPSGSQPPNPWSFNNKYPIDIARELGIEPPQSPSPKPEMMRHSITKTSRVKAEKSKGKPKRNLLARFALNRRASKAKAKIEVEKADQADYRDRWPTVTTLVAEHSDSRFFQDVNEQTEEEAPRSAKSKVLEAVATPIEWLADRLGTASEHIGHQVEVADARALKRASDSSSRKGSTRPGGSTHPYDTGVERQLPNNMAQDESEAHIERQTGPKPSGRPRLQSRARQNPEVGERALGDDFLPPVDDTPTAFTTDEDTVGVSKPRSKWRTVAGHRATGYPGNEPGRKPARQSFGTHDAYGINSEAKDRLRPVPTQETRAHSGAERPEAKQGGRLMSNSYATDATPAEQAAQKGPRLIKFPSFNGNSQRSKSVVTTRPVPTPPVARTHHDSGQRVTKAMRSMSHPAQMPPAAVSFAQKLAPLPIEPSPPKSGFLGQWLQSMLPTPQSRAVSPDESVDGLAPLDSPHIQIRDAHRERGSNASAISYGRARYRNGEAVPLAGVRRSNEDRPQTAPPGLKKGGWFRRVSKPSPPETMSWVSTAATQTEDPQIYEADGRETAANGNSKRTKGGRGGQTGQV
ncbi:hypothetical protein BKA67DRAFT_682468 [Truncatella angustata]|uniref:Uncharacterized protein n=1 Tax=Truncatella angustata TaxID=152316 RepID=A0A9P8UCY8_9PEZI|nr:uncharacterized protein BKA67DRAFT_682468 [Truncatella angustata]KAH6647348.1 hypothetical protein BKA67DRAFT_682468 [Truncatella angustata]KAH8203170.1 hypothetical protein TruAng_002691 [Truncatella angustata]